MRLFSGCSIFASHACVGRQPLVARLLLGFLAGRRRIRRGCAQIGHLEAPVDKHTHTLDAARRHPAHGTTREISLRETAEVATYPAETARIRP